MDIINSIKEHVNFSKSEEKVGNYIIKHTANIETFTITKLAVEAKTSTSAVLRFCQSLGFQGYKDFRFEVIQYLHSGDHNADTNDLINNYLTETTNIINQMKQIDYSKLTELITSLMNDEVNYLMGIYYSSLPAKELYSGLNDLGRPTIYSHDYINSSHVTRSMTDKSTFVYFSISGVKQDFYRFMPDIADNMPANSYLVTTNPKAELQKVFPNTIFLPGASFSNKSVTDAQSIPVIFVEMVLNIIHDKFLLQNKD